MNIEEYRTDNEGLLLLKINHDEKKVIMYVKHGYDNILENDKSLNDLCTEYRKKDYIVGIFISGIGDIRESIEEFLLKRAEEYRKSKTYLQ